jgi:hypothetical protein
MITPIPLLSSKNRILNIAGAACMEVAEKAVAFSLIGFIFGHEQTYFESQSPEN